VGLGVVGNNGQGRVAGRQRRLVVVVQEEKQRPVGLVACQHGVTRRLESNRLVEVPEGPGALLRGRVLAFEVDVGPAAVECGQVGPHGDRPPELRDRLVWLPPALVDLREGGVRQVVAAVEPDRRLNVAHRPVPIPAFEPEQPAVDQEHVAEFGVGRLRQQVFGRAVVGLDGLETRLRLRRRGLAPGPSSLRGVAIDRGSRVRGEATEHVEPGKPPLALEGGAKVGLSLGCAGCGRFCPKTTASPRFFSGFS
jgi:hypothetical protein